MLLFSVSPVALLFTVLQTQGGRVVSGSQDSTLKVFRLEDSLCLYTLHGHKDAITTLCLDKVAPLAAISGSRDGSLRIWDLLTGACVHQLKVSFCLVFVRGIRSDVLTVCVTGLRHGC